MTGFKIPEIIDSYNNILKQLNPYNPDVKKLQFDYLSQKSKLTLKITIPDSVNLKNIELPKADVFKITEVYNDKFDPVNLQPIMENGKWIIKSKNIPKTEKLLLTLNSNVSKEDISELVRIDAPEDPEKNDDTDDYWVHSAIRNMKIFENMYEELNIDNVQTSVRVGINRTFTSSAPSKVTQFLEARASMESAMNEKDRGKLFKSWSAYRSSKRNVGGLQTYQIFNLIQNLLNPNQFKLFIAINEPFRVQSVTTTDMGIPRFVNVNILTELTKRLPAVNGNLVFKKKAFSQDVKEKFDELIETKSKK